MRQRMILVGVMLSLVLGTGVDVLQEVPPPPPPAFQVVIQGLDNIAIPDTAFSFNPGTEQLEGSGFDNFAVKLNKAAATSGTVDITSVTCPITGQTQSGSSAGYLSSYLSRYDLILPSPSTTDVTLTVWIKVPLTVAPGSYEGGSIQITATATF